MNHLSISDKPSAESLRRRNAAEKAVEEQDRIIARLKGELAHFADKPSNEGPVMWVCSLCGSSRVCEHREPELVTARRKGEL